MPLIPTIPKSQYWPHFKNNKAQKSQYQVWFAHHPSRLSEINLSGSASLTIDNRVRYPDPPNGQSAVHTQYAVSIPSSVKLVRLWDKEPLGLYRSSPGTNEFYLQHQPYAPWRFNSIDQPVSISQIVGSATNTLYTWNSTTNNWEASSLPSNDVIASLDFSIEGGGNYYGGYDPANPDARAFVTVLPSVGGVANLSEIRRYPWLSAWDSDNSFNDAFDQYIDDLNTNAGASIATGSSSISVNFVF